MAGKIRSLNYSEYTGSSCEGFPRGFCEDCAFYAIKHKALSGSGMAFRLLDEMNKTYMILYQRRCLTSSLRFPFRNWAQLFVMRWSITRWEDDWLSFAIESGLSSYAVARISSNPSAISSKRGRPLLHYAVQGHFLPVLEYLLKNGSHSNLVSMV